MDHASRGTGPNVGCSSNTRKKKIAPTTEPESLRLGVQDVTAWQATIMLRAQRLQGMRVGSGARVPVPNGSGVACPSNPPRDAPIGPTLEGGLWWTHKCVHFPSCTLMDGRENRERGGETRARESEDKTRNTSGRRKRDAGLGIPLRHGRNHSRLLEVDRGRHQVDPDQWAESSCGIGLGGGLEEPPPRGQTFWRHTGEAGGAQEIPTITSEPTATLVRLVGTLSRHKSYPQRQEDGLVWSVGQDGARCS